MNRQLRIYLLSKLAQQTTQTIPALPNFVATNEYPTIVTGFGPTISKIINDLSSALNKILHFHSNGHFNLKNLKASGFTQVTTTTPDIINLTNLASLIFIYFYNSGNKFTKQLTAQEMLQRFQVIYTSAAFSKLREVPLSGQLATYVGDTTSDKARIKYYLDSMRSLIPA